MFYYSLKLNWYLTSSITILSDGWTEISHENMAMNTTNWSKCWFKNVLYNSKFHRNQPAQINIHFYNTNIPNIIIIYILCYNIIIILALY